MSDSEDAAAAPDMQYGVGPFTIREVSLLGVWVIAFIVSFFPLAGTDTPSVWTSDLLWILTIGVPTAAVGLVVLRRFSPDGIRRVGSLGVDQFASVAFSVAAVVWLQFVWSSVSFAIRFGGFPGGWVAWVELVLTLAGVVLTVVAPYLPVLGDDFQGRTEVAAHRSARPVRSVAARPASERAPKAPKPPKQPKTARDAQQPPVFDENSGAEPGYDPSYDSQAYDQAAYAPQAYAPQSYEPTASDGAYPQQTDEQRAVDAAFSPLATDAFDTGAFPPAGVQPVIAEQVVAEQVVEPTPAAAQQAFWALSPVERDVVDQNGAPLFRIGPTAWALVIEDRGTAFVVRDEDGRTGYLLDVSGVMRG